MTEKIYEKNNCTIEKTNLKAGNSDIYKITYKDNGDLLYGVGLSQAFSIARLMNLDHTMWKFYDDDYGY